MLLRAVRLGSFAALALLAFSFTGHSQPPALPSITIDDFIRVKLAVTYGHSDAALRLNDICAIDSEPIDARVFREYGAVFVGSGVIAPPRCVFSSDVDVNKFQSELKISSLSIAGTQIELQENAAQALRNAVEEAAGIGKRITPLDGAIAARRSYADTLRIWNSRFFRALDYWAAKGKITREEANYAVTLPIKEQVKRVMAWEAKGYYFSTNFSISIFNSVAPPGTSQHLSLLAFDVVESSDPEIRRILNKYGWFQTIRSDQPHFTYIGVPESELPRRGLTPVRSGSRTYWIPNVKPS